MFLYHLLGFLGNERYRGLGNPTGRPQLSKRKAWVLLGTIAALDLVEFFALAAFSYQFYLLSRS